MNSDAELVIEEIVKEGVNYAGQKEVIYTFPKHWTFEQCKEYAYDRCFNPFIYSITDDGRNQFTCAYSWKLSYQKMFDEYPND